MISQTLWKLASFGDTLPNCVGNRFCELAPPPPGSSAIVRPLCRWRTPLERVRTSNWWLQFKVLGPRVWSLRLLDVWHAPKNNGSARFYGSMVTESRDFWTPNFDLEDFPCPSSLLSVKGPAMSLDFLGHTTKSCKYFSRSFHTITCIVLDPCLLLIYMCI